MPSQLGIVESDAFSALGDRLGIKLFYYPTPNGYFIFASEINSLLTVQGFDAAPNDIAVFEFFIHTNCDFEV